MDRYERIATLHRSLKNARYPVPLSRLMDQLGCSRATLYRDVAFLRDGLGAPITSDVAEEQTVFSYGKETGERFELPGFWLSSEELAAVLALYTLIKRTDPGVLANTLEPFKARIETLLASQSSHDKSQIDRINVIPYGTRRLDQTVFRQVASAVLERQQLSFHYRGRSTDSDHQRHVSPQRLTHYRDNWYLDAFDHHRDALRSFAVDRIREVVNMGTPAKEMAVDALNDILSSSYGIFAGKPRAWATIRFSARAARWVADENWHPDQHGSWLPDGHYELKVPYSNSSELLGDVLKFGPDAEVIAPVELREKMKIQLQLTQGLYHPAG